MADENHTHRIGNTEVWAPGGLPGLKRPAPAEVTRDERTIKSLNDSLEAAAEKIAATQVKWDKARSDAATWERRYYYVFHRLRAVDPDVLVGDLCLDFTCSGCSNPGCIGHVVQAEKS